MQYLKGDIWQIGRETTSWVVVPTNIVTKANGEAVMGAGMAKDAALKFPKLPQDLGRHVKEHEERIFARFPIICLPTKYHFKEKSSIELIEKGCKELLELDNILLSIDISFKFLVPKLGCGLGGLNWEREVRPVMDSILNNNFILVSWT